MKRKFTVEIDRTTTRTGWICVDIECSPSDTIAAIKDRARREAYKKADDICWGEHEEGTPDYKIHNVTEEK